jgi:hypothetical protein
MARASCHRSRISQRPYPSKPSPLPPAFSREIVSSSGSGVPFVSRVSVQVKPFAGS